MRAPADEESTVERLYGEALRMAGEGRTGDAFRLFRRAGAFGPRRIEPIIALGALASRAGDARAAIGLFARALALDPLSPQGLYNRAAALKTLGEAAAAKAGFRQTVAGSPGLAAALAGLGRNRLESGETAEAVILHRRAFASDPGNADLSIDLGHAHRAAGDVRSAIDCYRNAATLDPGHVGALINLGAGLVEVGRTIEATGAFRCALLLAPGSADAHYNLAKAVSGDVRAMPLGRALALEPDLASAHLDLGVLRHGQGRLPEALARYRTAVALAPAMAAASHNAGALLMQQGLTPRSEPLFRRAVALDPASPSLLSDLLFCLCFDEAPDLDAVFAEHRRFGRRFADPGIAVEPFTNSRDPDRTLRIGYVSSNLHRHPVGHALLGLFRHHDRRHATIIAYAGTSPVDEMTQSLRKAADHWVDTGSLTDEALAAQVRRDRVDILVDCIGHLPQGRLLAFARRAAPVQIGFPVYPNTSGLIAMDYAIVDAEIAPSTADRRYTERLLRLPEVYACYHPAADTIEPAPGLPSLRTGVFTFASFNNPAKLGAGVLAAWAEILKRAPASRLILKWSGLDRRSAPVVELQRLGVDPAQLVVRDRSASAYAPYLDVDCCLDPFVNGGNTTLDALWMGVPVVTLRGNHLFARVGATFLRQVGLDELIANSIPHYIESAVALSVDRPRHQRLRHDLRRRVAASPVMDGRRYAGFLDIAYAATWRRWCAGLPPAAAAIAADGSVRWAS